MPSWVSAPGWASLLIVGAAACAGSGSHEGTSSPADGSTSGGAPATGNGGFLSSGGASLGGAGNSGGVFAGAGGTSASGVPSAGVDGTTRTWPDAISNCQTLTLDGGGWSLPTRMELTSILDDAQPSGARVNATFFKFAAKPGWTWASTPWVVDSRKTVSPPLSWFINFSAGDSNNSLDQTAASAYDRCVRIPATQTLPVNHYAVANGEVTDNYTCLVWQADGSDTTSTLSSDQASAYCKNLPLNGHTWRLPTLNELASVVDDVPSGDVSPAVDHTAFPNTAANAWYWTATPYGSSTTEMWSLNFEDGFTKHQPTTTLGIARCVR